MEKGAKTLLWILALSLGVGLAMLVLHADYREAARAMAKGTPDQSPIWLSNESYYPGIQPDEAP